MSNSDNYNFYESLILKLDEMIKFVKFIGKEYLFTYFPIVTMGTLVVKTLIIVDEKRLSIIKTLISILTAIFSSHIIINICKDYGLNKTFETILIILTTIYSDKVAKILVMEIDISLWIKMVYDTIIEETKLFIKNIFSSIQKKFKIKN